jgi:hypothetical protein
MAASSGTLATALVEFRSVVGAVRCAIEGQNAKAANDRSGSKAAVTARNCNGRLSLDSRSARVTRLIRLSANEADMPICPLDIE